MEQTLTEWYGPKIKPVHSGIYETRLASDLPIIKALWNGTRWFHDELRSEPLHFQRVYWRGLNMKGNATGVYAGLEDAPRVEKNNPLLQQVGGDHYKKLKIQPAQYCHANNMPFIEGCIIKYATRWRDKGGIKDLEKIKHFVDILIELESGK